MSSTGRQNSPRDIEFFKAEEARIKAERKASRPSRKRLHPEKDPENIAYWRIQCASLLGTMNRVAGALRLELEGTELKHVVEAVGRWCDDQDEWKRESEKLGKDPEPEQNLSEIFG